MSINNPFFSIIIPTLNEEQFLPKLLDDLKKQKNRNFEVIIVDGGSDDNTKKVATDHKEYFDLFFFDAKKRNVSYQRNFGAKFARGQYLIFLDADSRIQGAFIKKIQQETEKNKYLIFLPSIFPQDRTYQDMIIFNLANFFVVISQTIGKPFSTGGSLIFQKDFFNFIGQFNEKLYLSEDHELIQRARKYGVMAKLLKGVKVKVSLRRMRKEGRLDIFKKYLIAAAHTMTGRELDKKIFDYEMGGTGYKYIKSRSKTIDQTIKDYFDRIKKQIDQMVG